MQERRLKSSRRRNPETAADLVEAMTAPGRRGLPRRVPPALLAAITGTIAEVADPARQHERLGVALRNLEAAMSQASIAVRAVLDDLEHAKPRLPPRHK